MTLTVLLAACALVAFFIFDAIIFAWVLGVFALICLVVQIFNRDS